MEQESGIGSLDTVIEIVEAGIINGETVLKSPWHEKRLALKAINK